MRVVENILEIQKEIQKCKDTKKIIGLVPTMGALHEGHLSLVKQAKCENEIVIVSIFVNPIQFNNKEDLQNYPKTLEADLELLKQIGCDFVFTPSVNEMYPEQENEIFDFGMLDKVLEGKFRPGHFNGVAVVVNKFFQIINPDNAYFGAKDYQQLLIVKKLVEIKKLPVEIIACSTVREADGLAMSSRNRLLVDEHRQNASVIYKTLQWAKLMHGILSFDELKKQVTERINSVQPFQVEYFEIVSSDDLIVANSVTDFSGIIACIAVFAGKIRLIDNIILK